jgi:hypothetical protein
VVTAFDDYRPVVAVPVKVATEASMEAAIAVAKLGARTAKVITIA